MIKKICLLAVLLNFSVVLAFSQAQQKKVLSDNDVKNYIKNYDKIQSVMETYSDEIESYVDPLETDSFKGAIKLKNAVVSKEMQNELSQLGLGNNAFEKVIVLMFGTSVILIQQMMPAEAMEDEMEDEMMKEINAIKNAINPDDLKMINKYSEDLMELMSFF